MLSKPLEKAQPTATKPKDNQNSQNQAQNAPKEPDKESNKPSLHRSNAQRALLKSPEEQRRDDLALERDQHAPLISSQLYNYIITQVNQKTQEFLSTNKDALTLRDNLKKAATAAVQANIDATEGVTDEEKADAKKYAEEHVIKADIVASSLRSFAKDTVYSTVKSDNKTGLENKAKEGFNSVGANPKTPLPNQVAEAKKKAIKLGQAEADSLTNTFFKAIKINLTNKIKLDSTFLSGGLDVGDLGKEEIEQRHSVDHDLVDPSVIDTVYENKLFEPIKLATVMKLGVGRGVFSRTSKETKGFMKKLNTGAQEQVATDIGLKLDGLTAGNGDVAKKYYGMMAKLKANSMTEGSINKAVETKAAEITRKVLPDEEIKKQLKTAAQTYAYDIKRAKPAEALKISEAAKNGAEIKAIALLKAKQTIAVEEARMITKGSKTKPYDPLEVTANQERMTTAVKKQVTDDNVGEEAIKKVIEADTMNTGLSTIGKIINAAAPNPGDSSSFEFELKIPIYNSGAYFLFALGAEAERETDGLTVNSQITFGAGFQTWGLDANFRIGLFLEGKGKNADGVMKLISYGMYREIRNIKPEAAEYFWGHGGKSGMTPTEEAEVWAALIEERHMTGENYVDVGMIAALKGDINAGVAKMGGELSYKRLHHYDKETIEDRISAANVNTTTLSNSSSSGSNTNTTNTNSKTGFGEATDLSKLKDKAEALQFKANKHVIEAGLSTEVKFGDTSVAFDLEGAGSIVNSKLRELTISGKGSIPFAYGEDSEKMAEWAKNLSRFVGPIIGGAKNVAGIIKGKVQNDKELGSKTTSSVIDTGSDVMFAIPQFDEIGKSLAEKLKGDETVNDTVRGWITGKPITSSTETVNKILLSSSLDLSLKFKKEWDKAGVSKGWEIVLEAAQTKTFEVDAEIAKVTIEKTKSLGKIGFGMDKNGEMELKLGGLGFEKE